jgi:hypothetical protein
MNSVIWILVIVAMNSSDMSGVVNLQTPNLSDHNNEKSCRIVGQRVADEIQKTAPEGIIISFSCQSLPYNKILKAMPKT